MKRAANLLLRIAVLFLIAARVAAAEPQIKTLSNGMTVFLNPVPQESRIAAALSYHAGADSQTAQTAGLFRLLEIVLFNGLAIHPGMPEPAGALDALEPLKIAGGTEIDRLGFSILTDSSRYQQLIDTLYYLFSEKRINTLIGEAGSIEAAREISKGLIRESLGSSHDILEAAFAKKLFAKAPFRLDVNGAYYILEKADAQVLASLAAAWLVPANACLVVSGGFDPEAVLELIEQRFGILPKGKDPWPSSLPSFPRPGVTRPLFLVFPDPGVTRNSIQIEMRYRGPDPKDTSMVTAARLLSELAKPSTSPFQTAMRKSMPKGVVMEDLTLSLVPSRNASWISIKGVLTLSDMRKAPEITFAFKEAVRGSELYKIKANPAYFSAKEYQTAREILREAHMARMGDPFESVQYVSDLWSWGIISQVFRESDAIVRTGPKEISQMVDVYIQKNLEVVAVSLNSEDFTVLQKAFASLGFETISDQNAFWWR